MTDHLFEAGDPGHRPLPPARPRKRPQAPPVAEAESPTDDYAVGYRRPPRDTQFKPGRSGNPKGRPKAAKSMNTVVRDNLTQKVTIRTANGTRRITRIEAVIHKTIELAMKGNPRALTELLKLYSMAVPEAKVDRDDGVGSLDELTAADLAILKALQPPVAPEETGHDS